MDDFIKRVQEARFDFIQKNRVEPTHLMLSFLKRTSMKNYLERTYAIKLPDINNSKLFNMQIVWSNLIDRNDIVCLYGKKYID